MLKQIFYILLILSSIVIIPLARSDSIGASGGYITQLDFSNSSRITDHWQGFYGTIQDRDFISLNMTGQGGNVSRWNINSTTYIRFLLFSNSTLDTFSGFQAGNLSQIDAIISTIPDNATNTFLYQSDFILGSTTIYDVPTTYTYVNGSQQFSAFREGFLTNGKALIFIVELGRTNGFNNISYDYQAILPISQSLNTYYVYAITETTPSTSTSSNGGSSGDREGVTTEDCFDIILSKETRYGLVREDLTNSYTFVSQPVIFVNFVSTINIDGTPVIIEVMRNSPCIAKISPPGIVYKNINIWVGRNYGFGVKEYISQGLVVFEVNKSWIASHNIDSSSVKLMQYVGNWISLATKQIGENENVIYYIANPQIFSHFAIVGEKIAEPTPNEEIVVVTTVAIADEGITIKFILIVGIAAILITILVRKFRKKRAL